MQDYVSQIFSNFRKCESAPKHEDAHTDAAQTILDNLKRIKHDFKWKVLEPAKDLQVTLDFSDHKLADKSNPHIRAIHRVMDAISDLEDQLEVQASDPFRKEEENDNVGADAPSMPDAEPDPSEDIAISDGGGDIEESAQKPEDSNSYYRNMHPEKTDDEILQLNGWNYSGNEIYDDQGVCSIVYDPDSDMIVVYELMDPDGIEQEQVATCSSVEELDDALTNFVELDEIAPEMKEAFANYIAGCRGQEVHEDAEEPPVPQQPVIIDEWEYMAQDPEFLDNATLLYDKNRVVVFIQRDKDSENPQPYYANTINMDQENQEKQSASLDDICKWLEVNDLPVPTEDAKLALQGNADESINEAKEDKKDDKKCKLPDGMKCVKDDPSTTTLAPAVKKPEVAKVEEPEKAKKK